MSLAQNYFYKPAVGEELFGTWVDPQPNLPTSAQKLVCYPWGLVEWYNSVDGAVYDWRGTITIVEKWTDSEGNTWYRNFERWVFKDAYGSTVHSLCRVNNDEQILEMIFAGAGWPNPVDLDPNLNTSYVKYRRRQ